MFIVAKQSTCASGSVVEHFLAKEGVAGSDPPSRCFLLYLNLNPIAVYGVKLYTVGSAFMKIIRKIIICILIIIMVYCAYNIIMYYTDSYNNKKVYKDIRNVAFNSSEDSSPDSSSDIESYDRLNYNKLLNTNPDFVGWIKIKGTDIDYPVVQGTDNEYYLHHDFKKRNAICGTIFIDSRCNISSGNNHLILYGHQMKDGSMFKQLNNYKKDDFYKKHKEITLYLNESVYTYEVVSVYVITISQNADYYNYINEDSRSAFINYINEKMLPYKLYDTDISINENDSILSLSTCEYSSSDGRLIVLAKRI